MCFVLIFLFRFAALSLNFQAEHVKTWTILEVFL